MCEVDEIGPQGALWSFIYRGREAPEVAQWMEQAFEEDRGQPTVSSFTSPKKMMLLREAAREREGLEMGENRLATLAGVASELVAKAGGAPEILVVPSTSDREVSTETHVTVETSRPRVTALASTGLVI